MLINKKYNVLITNRNITRFKDKYQVIRNEETLIDVKDLSIGSHLDVEIICDRCSNIFQREYKNFLTLRKKYNYDTCNKCKYEKTKLTNLEKYGVENTFQSEEKKEKIRETCIEKYGVDNPAKSQVIKDKIIKTNLERYGMKYGLSNSDIRKLISETKAERGLQRQTKDIEDYTIYKNGVNTLTKQKREYLLENWNGFDYYDNEYIKENYNLHSNDKNYPTVDHKKSVLNCYLDGDSQEEASNISNLCITKKSINSSKCYRNEEEYKKNSN